MIYVVTTFLSAFLLFMVQPMMGKLLLPWFGGAAAVWTTCIIVRHTRSRGGVRIADADHFDTSRGGDLCQISSVVTAKTSGADRGNT